MGLGVAQQAQQVGRPQRGRRGGLLHVGANARTAVAHLTLGEQGPGLVAQGLDLVRIEGERVVGALQREIVLSALQVELGQAVVDGVAEGGPTFRREVQTRLQVFEGAVEVAQLAARGASGPQAVGVVRLAGEHRAGQLGHGPEVLVPVDLVQQLAGGFEVPARRGLQHPAQGRQGGLAPIEAEQGPDARLGQGQHGAALLLELQVQGVAGLALGGARHVHHRVTAGGAPLRGPLQHLIGQLQCGAVAAGVAQQVQQVGLVEEPRAGGGLEAEADDLLGLVHPAQPEQGAGLGLGAAGLVRRHGQGEVGLLHGLLVLTAAQVEIGQRVVHRVGEPLAGVVRRVQAGLQVGEGPVEVASLAARRAAHPQAVRVIRVAVEDEVRQVDHRRPVLAVVGLEEQFHRRVEVAPHRGDEAAPDGLAGVLGAVQPVQGAGPALGQRDHGAAALAEVPRALGPALEVHLLAGEDAGGEPGGGAQGRVGRRGALEHAVAELQGGLVALRVAQQVEQVRGLQRDARGGLLHAGPDPGLAALPLTQGEQGADLELHALGLVRLQLQRARGVFEDPLVVAADHVDLGQGVVDGVREAEVVLGGGVQGGVQVGQGALAGAELAARGAPDPQAVGLAGEALEDRGGQVDHGAPLVAAVGLEEQFGHLVEVAARGGAQGAGHDLAGPLRVAEGVQGPDHTLQQGPHQLALLAEGDVVADQPVDAGGPPLRREGHGPHTLGAGHAPLLGAGEHGLAQLQRGVVALARAQQVQQVRLVEEDAVGRRGDAGAHPVLALVLAAQGEQRLDLELHALGLGRVQIEGALRVVHRLLVLAAQQQDLGHGVVQRVLEPPQRPGLHGQHGAVVGEGLVQVPQLAQGGAADPAGVRLVGDPLEHGIGHGHDALPLLVEVHLEQQLRAHVEVAAGHGGQRVGDDLTGLGLAAGAVQGDDAALEQGEDGAAHLAEGGLSTQQGARVHLLAQADVGQDAQPVAALLGAGEQRAGQIQGLVVAVGVAEQVQQVRRQQAAARRAVHHHVLDRVGALLEAAQGEQGAGARVHGVAVVGIVQEDLVGEGQGVLELAVHGQRLHPDPARVVHEAQATLGAEARDPLGVEPLAPVAEHVAVPDLGQVGVLDVAQVVGVPLPARADAAVDVDDHLGPRHEAVGAEEVVLDVVDVLLQGLVQRADVLDHPHLVEVAHVGEDAQLGGALLGLGDLGVELALVRGVQVQLQAALAHVLEGLEGDLGGAEVVGHLHELGHLVPVVRAQDRGDGDPRLLDPQALLGLLEALEALDDPVERAGRRAEPVVDLGRGAVQ